MTLASFIFISSLQSVKDLWLALFDAETEEELDRLITDGGDVMSQAIEAYRGITASEEFKYLEHLRSKARHDEAQAIRNAERREREKWQSVAEENERLRQELAELRSRQ